MYDKPHYFITTSINMAEKQMIYSMQLPPSSKYTYKSYSINQSKNLFYDVSTL